MARSPSSVLCNALCSSFHYPRVPFESQLTVPCTVSLMLHGKEPMSGREHAATWHLLLTLELRIVDDNALDEWLPANIDNGGDTRRYISQFVDRSVAASLATEGEQGPLRKPTVSDVKMQPQEVMAPLTPTPEYKEHVVQAVCSIVARDLRAQHAGMHVEPRRCVFDSASGPVPSPLDNLKAHLQRAFKGAPRGLVRRLPAAAFVLDAISGTNSLYAESRPVGGGLVRTRSSQELVLSGQFEASTVPGPGGGLVRDRSFDDMLRQVGTSVHELQATFGGGGYNRWLLSLVQPQGAGGGANLPSGPGAGFWVPSAAAGANPSASAVPAKVDSSGGDDGPSGEVDKTQV